jgi:regulatory protein
MKKSNLPPEEVLREDALRLLVHRARSEAELKDRLLRKGHPLPLIESLLERFMEVGLVNDRNFAVDLAAYHRRMRPLGRFGLTMELISKGVAESLAKEVVEEKLPIEEEFELAKEIAQNILNRTGDWKSKWIKLSSLLGRRGFSYDTIEKLRNHMRSHHYDELGPDDREI